MRLDSQTAAEPPRSNRGPPTRTLDVLCRGCVPSRPKPLTSSGVASVAGMARFLRPLDSTVLCSVMRPMMSSVMPALACAQGGGCSGLRSTGRGSLLCSIMRATMSTVMPALACAQGCGRQQASHLSSASAIQGRVTQHGALASTIPVSKRTRGCGNLATDSKPNPSAANATNAEWAPPSSLASCIIEGA